jgi:hypothetical protein
MDAPPNPKERRDPGPKDTSPAMQRGAVADTKENRRKGGLFLCEGTELQHSRLGPGQRGMVEGAYRVADLCTLQMLLPSRVL